MKDSRKVYCSLSAALLLAGCAGEPVGPTVAAMPPPNKPFEQFASEQEYCKQYAQQQVSGAAQSANNQAVGTAVIGTLLGAGLGAAVGGGSGAAIGAAGGAVAGTSIGASGSQNQQYGIQGQYDNAYAQCMYAKGNQVPGTQAADSGYQPPTSAPPPPQAENIPPPPYPTYVWQPGYWAWNGYQYQWVPGHYQQRPSQTAVWVPDHWQQYQSGWAFIPGHWEG